MHDVEELKDLVEAGFDPDTFLDFLDIDFRDLLDRFEDELIEHEQKLRAAVR